MRYKFLVSEQNYDIALQKTGWVTKSRTNHSKYLLRIIVLYH